MAEPGRPRVYASVLFWSRQELPLVERCVDSLLAQAGVPAEVRVLVVDNGSGLTPTLPEHVELLRLRENLGFAGGHNAGMRVALDNGADYVFLVNSDVVVERTCLQQLLASAAAWPALGILGPLIESQQTAGRVESSGQTFDVRTGRHRELSRGQVLAEVDARPHTVDAVSGCALLARRAVLEQVGLFDEALYLYFEDMDWCLRARRAGFGVGVIPRARVWHQGSGSTWPAWPGTTFYSVRNHLVVARRYAQGPLVGVLPLLVLAYHLAFLVRSREHRTPTHLWALVRGAFAACTVRMGRQAGFASSD